MTILVGPNVIFPFLQVLLEDFSCSGGYKLLYDYLLHLERMGTEDAREAERNMVLLISNNLVPAGFLNLEPTLNDGGPLQDPHFVIPAPHNDGEKYFTLSMNTSQIVAKDVCRVPYTTVQN